MATHGSIYKLLKKLDAIADGDLNILGKTDRLQLIHDQVQQQLALAYKTYAARYDLRTRERSFQIGQEVYRRNFSLSNAANHFNAKLAKKFLKCRIAAKLGSSIYKLEDLQGRPLGNFHAKDLRV